MINLFDRPRRYLNLAIIVFAVILVLLVFLTVLGWRIPWFALAWWQVPAPQHIGMLRWDQQGLPVPVAPSESFTLTYSDVAFDGNKLWVTYSKSKGENGFVVSYDPLTGKWGKPIEVGIDPRGVLFDGQHIWVANRGDGTVLCIPLTQENSLVSQPGKPGIRNLAYDNSAPNYLAFDGDHVWVTVADTNDGDNPDTDRLWRLSAVDRDCNKDPEDSDDSVEVEGLKKPFGIIFDGTYIWVANQGSNKVLRLNPDDCSASKCEAKAIDVHGQSSNLAYDGTFVWVTLKGTGKVARIHARTGQVFGQPVFGQPITLPSPTPSPTATPTPAVSPNPTDSSCLDEPKEIDGITFDGIYIWVASNSGCVYQLRAADVSLISHFKVVFETIGEGKEHTPTPEPRSRIAFDGTFIWIIITDGTKSSFTRR